jgi:hypothetical protein
MGSTLSRPPLILGQQAVGDQDEADATRNHDRLAAEMLEPKSIGDKMSATAGLSAVKAF